jgi:16S rRNA A1518/A1519 N6-dimethyltransferase RsmA/KsgA/DIM1 with predicted DNA glycosylase/AP lyase activity
MNPVHLELCASEEWREALRDVILPYALGKARLGDDVLEVGPGPGITTDLLRTRLARLTAVELDEELAAEVVARGEDGRFRAIEARDDAAPPLEL